MPIMLLAVVIVCLLLSGISGTLGLFAVPKAEPIYMGICALSSGLGICAILVSYALTAAAPA